MQHMRETGTVGVKNRTSMLTLLHNHHHHRHHHRHNRHHPHYKILFSPSSQSPTLPPGKSCLSNSWKFLATRTFFWDLRTSKRISMYSGSVSGLDWSLVRVGGKAASIYREKRRLHHHHRHHHHNCHHLYALVLRMNVRTISSYSKPQIKKNISH